MKQGRPESFVKKMTAFTHDIKSRGISFDMNSQGFYFFLTTLI
jgi:hypothetical protein